MSSQQTYKCDVCGKKIKEGHQQYYMVTLKTDYLAQLDDGSCAGTELVRDTYHIHNDFSNDCMGKIWDILVKDRK